MVGYGQELLSVSREHGNKYSSARKDTIVLGSWETTRFSRKAVIHEVSGDVIVVSFPA